MNCKNTEIKLSQMIDGEITHDEASAIKSHISKCTACAELYQKILDVDLRVRAHQLPVVSSGFDDALTAKLDQVSLNRRRKVSTIKISALAAGLMVFFIAVFVPKSQLELTKPISVIPGIGLDQTYTPCEDSVSCGTLAFCSNRDECGVQYNQVSDWITRNN